MITLEKKSVTSQYGGFKSDGLLVIYITSLNVGMTWYFCQEHKGIKEVVV